VGEVAIEGSSTKRSCMLSSLVTVLKKTEKGSMELGPLWEKHGPRERIELQKGLGRQATGSAYISLID